MNETLLLRPEDVKSGDPGQLQHIEENPNSNTLIPLNPNDVISTRE